jgi:sulfite dehydrogenase
MLLLTERPPQLETPLNVFRKDITPNESFFVRWHYSGIPTSVDPRTFRLAVSGQVNQSLSLSLKDLRTQYESTSLIAVAQCSGNSRSLFEPRVTGGQWGNGAVGNAKWTGVRLRDILQRAGAKDGAIEVSFAGLDRAPLPDMPPFMKSLDIKRAMDADTIVAYAMNDAPLPMLNGYPLRLIVPGWYATYWVKSLSQITVLNEKLKSFWMNTAYRIPNNPDGTESPKQLATDLIPINRFTVHSLFVRPEPNISTSIGKPIEIEGLAMDAGEGIRRVEVSTNDGKTWTDARLDPELGKYSWRRWRCTWNPQSAGTYRLLCKATNAKGETQSTQQWNRSGYQRNLIEHLDVTVA